MSLAFFYILFEVTNSIFFATCTNIVTLTLPTKDAVSRKQEIPFVHLFIWDGVYDFAHKEGEQGQFCFKNAFFNIINMPGRDFTFVVKDSWFKLGKKK